MKSYTNDPQGNRRDALRYLIGDWNPPEKLEDEQLDFELSQTGSLAWAGSNACEAIAALYSDRADKSVGDLRVSFSQKAAAYAERAVILRERSTLAAGGPVVADTSRPFFRVNMLDEPPFGVSRDEGL